MEKSEYFAIIPAAVRYDKELSPNAKLIFGELVVLCEKNGFCWASNGYFARLYGVDKVSVSRWIAQLRKKGYIFFKGIDKNVNTLDENVNGYRQICIDPLYKIVNQNIKMNNIKNNKTRTRKGGNSLENGSAYDLEAFEKMVDSK